MARTPRVPGPVTISRRRLYILPTRSGYGYAAMLLVMLLGAMNYSNSMSFALTFLLASLGLIGMHHTHGNLVNLRLLDLRAEPVFAGDQATFELHIENCAASPRWTLGADWNNAVPTNHIDLEAGAKANIPLRLDAPQRGWLEAPRLAVLTEFPLGLFHAWTWVLLDSRCLVYPKPADYGFAPPALGGGHGQTLTTHAGIDEFAGLRDYQRGDSASRVHWKSLARATSPTTPIQVKEFGDTRDTSLWLDWSALPANLDLEARLSQLCRWILDADAAGRPYGLRLPNAEWQPAHGQQHRADCLRALALFAPAPVATNAGTPKPKGQR